MSLFETSGSLRTMPTARAIWVEEPSDAAKHFSLGFCAARDVVGGYTFSIPVEAVTLRDMSAAETSTRRPSQPVLASVECASIGWWRERCWSGFNRLALRLR
ncbi:hypothetical protein A1D31_38820 [Bradyrhizobium liaoningense]|nr:hypothetical protein A1D31_38820 [Bradyrhizobium liaoningense]